MCYRLVRLFGIEAVFPSKGWSEQQAIDYMLRNTNKTEARVRAETKRYLVSPGQATAYMIGMLKIQELRDQAELALGENFSIRDFHDVVLGGGALPLEMLARSTATHMWSDIDVPDILLILEIPQVRFIYQSASITIRS